MFIYLIGAIASITNLLITLSRNKETDKKNEKYDLQEIKNRKTQNLQTITFNTNYIIPYKTKSNPKSCKNHTHEFHLKIYVSLRYSVSELSILVQMRRI